MRLIIRLWNVRKDMFGPRCIALWTAGHAHVSPSGIFGITEQKEANIKGKYFAADGSPIDKFGKPAVNAILEGGAKLATS